MPLTPEPMLNDEVAPGDTRSPCDPNTARSAQKTIFSHLDDSITVRVTGRSSL